MLLLLSSLFRAARSVLPCRQELLEDRARGVFHRSAAWRCASTTCACRALRVTVQRRHCSAQPSRARATRPASRWRIAARDLVLDKPRRSRPRCGRARSAGRKRPGLRVDVVTVRFEARSPKVIAKRRERLENGEDERTVPATSASSTQSQSLGHIEGLDRDRAADARRERRCGYLASEKLQRKAARGHSGSFVAVTLWQSEKTPRSPSMWVDP